MESSSDAYGFENQRHIFLDFFFFRHTIKWVTSGKTLLSKLLYVFAGPRASPVSVIVSASHCGSVRTTNLFLLSCDVLVADF